MQAMAEEKRSAFIPRQASVAPTRKRTRRSNFGVLSFIGTVALVGVLLLSGGMFLYKQYLDTVLEEQQALLASERNRFSEADIASVREFDRRLDAAAFLLDNRLMVSSVFDAIAPLTMQRVQFRSFLFERHGGEGGSGQESDGLIEVVFGGATEEFATLALQAETFAQESIFSHLSIEEVTTNASFSNQVDDAQAQEGAPVQFEVRARVLPTRIAYAVEPLPSQVNQMSDEEEEAAAPDAGQTEAPEGNEEETPPDAEQQERDAPPAAEGDTSPEDGAAAAGADNSDTETSAL